MAIWDILRLCGMFYGIGHIFPYFGMLSAEKSGSPVPRPYGLHACTAKEMYRSFEVGHRVNCAQSDVQKNCFDGWVTRTQSYDCELPRQRSKFLQRHG
jgi:hypothetical protein